MIVAIILANKVFIFKNKKNCVLIKNAANPFEKWSTLIRQVLHKIGYPIGNKYKHVLKVISYQGNTN